MEPRFTRGEYWLLETVVEGGRPFVYIHAPEFNQALNKTGHGLDRASLVDTLERLFQNGLIGAARLSAGGCAGPFQRRLSRAAIEAALDETRNDDEDRDSAYDFDEVESNWQDAPDWFMQLIDNRRWCRWI